MSLAIARWNHLINLGNLNSLKPVGSFTTPRPTAGTKDSRSRPSSLDANQQQASATTRHGPESNLNKHIIIFISSTLPGKKRVREKRTPNPNRETNHAEPGPKPPRKIPATAVWSWAAL
jgi:hypothetical protein